MKAGNLSVTSVRGQQLICLLYALHEMGGINSAQEVCEFIHCRGYLLLCPKDRSPYPSQMEPRWRTDIRWRRKDGVQSGLITGDEHNEWEINRAGILALEAVEHGASRGLFSLDDCYLWSTGLKRAFLPGFVPSQDVMYHSREKRRSTYATPASRVVHQLFARGDGELLATRLSEKIGRPVLPAIGDCSSAYAEFRESENNRTVAMVLEVFG